MNYPLLVLGVSFLILVVSTRIGDTLRKRAAPSKEEARTDAALLLSATLTLLYFIIGFTFSMAINRYDLRKSAELGEAVAIGTAHARADLMPAPEAAKAQSLLARYVDQRLLFYSVRSPEKRDAIVAESVRLQAEIWTAFRTAAAAVPPPLMGMLVSAGNDLSNSQRSSQAAWMNRIPSAAWALMALVAVGNCWLIGYRARRTDWLAFLIVPVAASVSFFLIADLDSPLGGAVRVGPQNLAAVAQSLHGR